MTLPTPVLDLLRLYAHRFPVPTGAPGEAHEENVRQWTITFAEQVAYSVGPEWGMKRADPNRPISKDTITRQAGGRLECWDLLIGTGTGQPRVADDPAYHDITGQVFVPVAPTNHLGVPVPPAPTPPPPVADAEVVALLKEIRANQHLHMAILRDLLARPDAAESVKALARHLDQKPAPVYVGSTRPFGGPVRLIPEGR